MAYAREMSPVPRHEHQESVIQGCVDYRSQHLDGRKAAREAIAEAHAAGGKICAFFCESVLSCGGQASPTDLCRDPILRSQLTTCLANQS